MVDVGINSLTAREFFNTDGWIPALAASFMVGGGYPLTQVYQHESDKADHVKTISMLLGYKGTFLFSAILFGAVSVILFIYFKLTGAYQFWLFILFLFPVITWFLTWMTRVWKNPQQANFKNAMRMNSFSGWCMNSYFLLLIVLRVYPVNLF